MTWKDINKTFGRISLVILEYLIKCCAFIAALVAMGSSGSLMEKVASGFGGLPVVFQKIPSAAQQLSEMAAVVRDYHTQTMEIFANSHGYDAISSLILELNDVVLYFSAINQNFSEATLSTLGASAIVFFGFFFVSLMLRIARRKGKDLFWARVEKMVWNKFFETDQPGGETDRKKGSIRTSQHIKNDIASEQENEEPEIEEEWSDPTVFDNEAAKGNENQEQPKREYSLSLVEKSEPEEEIIDDLDEVSQNGHVQEYSEFEDSDEEGEGIEGESKTNLMSALDLNEDDESETTAEPESTIDSEVEDKDTVNEDSEEEMSNNSNNNTSSLDQEEQELDKELSRAKEESSETPEKAIKHQNNSLNEFLEMARSSSG